MLPLAVKGSRKYAAKLLTKTLGMEQINLSTTHPSRRRTTVNSSTAAKCPLLSCQNHNETRPMDKGHALLTKTDGRTWSILSGPWANESITQTINNVLNREIS